VAKLFSRFETVEWLYDGLNGKIIPWTREHGGTSDDPSVLVFLVGPDGKVVEKAPDREADQAKAFAKWLESRADEWERSHPRTKVPFVWTAVTASGSGADRRVACAELDQAHAKGDPVAVYVGLEKREGDDATGKTEAAAASTLERWFKKVGTGR